MIHDHCWKLGRALTSEENRLLALQYRDGTVAEREEARIAMVHGNQGLVARQIRRFARAHPQGHGDRMQDGNVGLLRAIEEFDPDLGVAFSTYSGYWIFDAIVKGERLRCQSIRVPVWTESKQKRSAEAIANVARATTVGSLDDEPAQTRIVDPGDRLARVERIAAVREAVDTLPPAEKRVIQLRFGIGCDRHSIRQAQEAVGGVSPQRITQIRQSALDKLKEVPSLQSLAS